MNQPTALWPLLVYSALAVIVVAVMAGLSYVLGQRHRDKATIEPFESGIVTTGSARFRFSPQFYLIALFFVIFDLEAVFIFAWAIAFRQTGWTGYYGVLVFIIALLAALVYVWRTGVLDLAPSGRKIIAHYQRMSWQNRQLK
jgi:NADH-quinone oxidoreductase subunit A